MAIPPESMTTLHKLYSPSVWNKRFPVAQEVEDHHIEYVTTISEQVVSSIPSKLEIEYGPTQGQKLDIIGTDLPDDAPILVYVHGGYWQILRREISRYPAQSLYRSKIKVVIVGYDLCPNVTLPEIVEQIQNAARFVFGYAEKMGSRGVYFAGHSAGAHLVTKLLGNADFLTNTQGSQRLQGAFLISGIFDLRDLVLTPYNDAIQLPQERAVGMSPLFDCYKHLRERQLRIYIVVGQNDSPVYIKQSKELYELLQDTCFTQNMYLEIKDDMDHFNIVECFAKDDNSNYLRNLLVHDIGKYL